MGKIKRIGMITSGGDCGGLNAVIKGAADMGIQYGIETVIIPNGYAGLYNLGEIKELVRLSLERLALFSVTAAGSEAGHSRVKVSAIKDAQKYERIKKALAQHKVDALIISGGDDTGSVAADLSEHNIPVIHVPKTMDFDLQPYSVGADSTMNIIGEMGKNLSTTGQTHNRVIVLEVFGRYVGHSAFRGGIAADADCILIPEITPEFDIVYEHVFQRYTQRIKHSDVHSGWYLIVTAEAMRGKEGKDEVNEEGFLIDKTAKPDAFGHYPLAGAGKTIEKELARRMKNDMRMKEFMQEMGMYVQGQNEIPEVRTIRPTHLVRCGTSSAYDVNFGRAAGGGAVELLRRGLSGVTVVSTQRGETIYMPIAEAIKRRPVDLADVAFFEAQGICFGRKPEEYKGTTLKEFHSVTRHM